MIRTLLLSLAGAVALSGCGAGPGGPAGNDVFESRPEATQEAGRPTDASPIPTPAKVAGADVAKLKWIEGDWKGMDGDRPFYERYRLENGRALVVDSFETEKFEKPTETKRYELKDGLLGNSGDTRWAASEITADSVTFVPVSGAKNMFTFKRVSADSWTATLGWPEALGKQVRQKVYNMQRIGR